MSIFKPLVSAADSLPAILLAVLIGHLLWFAGIHGAAIVSGMLQMFWLTNTGANQTALAASQPLPHIFMEAFWTFFIVIGGSGATMGLVFCYLRSRSAHLRSIGRLSVVPSIFNINEPVIFGTPIVMNPVFFIPFLLAPMVNAVLAWAAMKFDLIGRVISVVPWTAPARLVPHGRWAGISVQPFWCWFWPAFPRLSISRSSRCTRNSCFSRKRKKHSVMEKRKISRSLR